MRPYPNPEKPEDFRTTLFDRGDLIRTREDLAYYIVEGAVKITSPSIANLKLAKLSNSKPDIEKDKIVAIVPPRTMFEVFDRSQNVQVLSERAMVTWYNHNHLEGLPNLRAKLAIDTKVRLKTSEQLKNAVTEPEFIDCIYNLLLFMNNKYSDLLSERVIPFVELDEPSWIQVPISLTHEEIANTIGSTRVTVTRLMKFLSESGEIKSLRSTTGSRINTYFIKSDN